MLESYLAPIAVGLGRLWQDLVGPTVFWVRGYGVEADWVLQSLVAIAELIWLVALVWARRARQPGLNRRLAKRGFAVFACWFLLLAFYQIHTYEVSRSYLLDSLSFSIDDPKYQVRMRMLPATGWVTISGLVLVVGLTVQFWANASLRPLLGCGLVVSLVVAGSVFRFLPDSSIVCRLSGGTWEEQKLAWEHEFTANRLFLERGVELAFATVVASVPLISWHARRFAAFRPKCCSLGLAGVFCGAGLVCFVGTRAHHHDSLRAMSFSDLRDTKCGGIDEMTLPAMGDGTVIGNNPRLAHLIQGQFYAWSGTPNDLRKAVFEAGHALFEDEKAKRSFSLAVSGETPLAEVRRILDAATEMDVAVRAVVVEAERSIETLTLGNLRRTPRCGSIPVPSPLPEDVDNDAYRWSYVVGELQRQQRSAQLSRRGATPSDE